MGMEIPSSFVVEHAVIWFLADSPNVKHDLWIVNRYDHNASPGGGEWDEDMRMLATDVGTWDGTSWEFVNGTGNPTDQDILARRRVLADLFGIPASEILVP